MQKMGTVMSMIGEYKRFLMVVADESITCMNALVCVGLQNGSSIWGIMTKVVQAAARLYKPKDFQEKDMMQAVVLYRFGGMCMVELMHKATGVPRIRSIQGSSLALTSPIEASAATPTIHEICCNIRSVFPANADSEPIPTCHQYCNIKIDEIKVEEQPRYDIKTNQIYGLCHEHICSTEIAIVGGI